MLPPITHHATITVCWRECSTEDTVGGKGLVCVCVWFPVGLNVSCDLCVSGASGGLTEPGEDNVTVLSVHGDVHGPGVVRSEFKHLVTPDGSNQHEEPKKTCHTPPSCVFSPSSQITIEAMKSEIDEVALQGIEFWSNVCDEEMDLAIEASEVSEQRTGCERARRGRV